MQVEYTLQDFSNYLCQQLNFDKVDLDDADGFDVVFNDGTAIINKGSLPGSMIIKKSIGKLPLSDDDPKILQLVVANFIGLETFGTTLYLDNDTLGVRAVTPPGSTLEQMLEIMEALVGATKYWREKLAIEEIKNGNI